MNVVYEKPTISRGVLSGPLAIANKGFPYNDIADSRRFEELLYSIYKTKIDNGTLGQFDDVSLMTGVRDQGRDCVLLRSGKTHGLIQCKKYEKNYGKNDLGIEITRFVLFSLLEEALIHDQLDFTYYIAVSKGFTAECIEFIHDFSNVITNEPNLLGWISKNLEIPTLSSLKFGLDYDEVKQILANIKVKKIIPQDLDKELSSPTLSHLAPLFFEVKTVVDNTKIDELLAKFGHNLSQVDIIKKLKSGSVSLNSERNSFDDIEDSHVPRRETDELYKWIISEDQKKSEGIQNVCLLVGQAGYGKTVVLKDLYDKCRDNEIPVLGLKADKLYAYTLEGLQQSLGFPIPVNDFVESCKSYYKKTVILIDQIDALSQSMASDRNYLNVFRNFIDNFVKDDCVKIVISVRPYDLYYDPSLRVYKNMQTFELKPLDESDVLAVLSKINVKRESISPKLLEHLTVPNHLNIYVRIAASGEVNLQTTSIQGLYFELWDKKIMNVSTKTSIERSNLKSVLYKISNQMFSSQRITVSSFQFEDSIEEIKYLESERLIKREGKQLQFFHQSFYDFVFAKQFVEDNNDIIEYVKQSEQSIHIRSALKMIISYLRDYDEPQYKYAIKQIFDDDEILFHIKHLLFSTIVSQNNPLKQEGDLVIDLVNRFIHLQLLFFELANSKTWFDLALYNGLLEVVKDEITAPAGFKEGLTAYRKKVIFFFLRNYIVRHNSPEAWLFLKSIKDNTFIQEVLYSVENWSNPISYELFERCKEFETTDPFGFYHVLDSIAKQNEDYAVKILAKLLPSHFEKSKSDKDYEEKEVLKTLAKACPHKLFPILYDCINNDLKKEVEYNEGLIRDWKYNNVDLNDRENILGSEYIYQLLAICLQRTAKRFPTHFLSFFNKHKSSKYQAILRSLLFSLHDNEQKYHKQIFEIFCILFESKLVNQDTDLEYELRNLIERSFGYLEPKQKDYVILEVKQYKNRYEIGAHTYGEPKKKHFHSHWGLGKYYWLLRLPEEVVAADEELKRPLQEFNRRFGIRKEKRRNRSGMAGVVHSPINPQAHQYMTNKQWLKAFKKYHDNPRRWGDDFLKGGLDELASTFHKIVQENPSEEKLELIKSVLNDTSVNIKYAVYGLWGWTEKRNDLKEKTIPLFKTILNNEHSSDISICISIASQLIDDADNDGELIKFLIDQALDFKNYKKKVYNDHRGEKTTTINGLVTSGINTLFGSAAQSLVHIQDKDYRDVIFDTIEKILTSGPREARAVLYWRFAYLMHLDEARAYEMFKTKINLEDDIHVIAASLWSLQYMRNIGLEKISKPYERLVKSNLMGKDDSYLLFSILFGSYLHEQSGARDLLLKLLYTNKDIISRGTGDILKYYYEVPNSKKKNDELLTLIVKQMSTEDEEDMTLNFVNVEHVKINDIYNFLVEYISSPKFKLSEYFLKYLTYQCGHSVQDAIEIFDLAIGKHGQVEINNKAHYRSDETALKFIVGAYDCLHGKDEESKAKRKKLLLSFDKILQDYRLRRNADHILEKIT